MKTKKKVSTVKRKLHLDQALEEVARKLRPEAAYTGITITDYTGCPCCWSKQETK